MIRNISWNLAITIALSLVLAPTMISIGLGGYGVAIAASTSNSFDFNATNEPIQSVLLRLGKQLGVNIVINGAVQGRVSVSLHSATIGQALDAILVPLGYSYQVLHGVIVVHATTSTHVSAAPSASPAVAPAVLSIATIPVRRAEAILHGLFPRDRITADPDANALIVTGSPDDINAMRGVLAGIDVVDPTRPTAAAIQLRYADPHSVAVRLQSLYPNSRIASGPNHTLLVEAVPADMAQIRAVVASVDQTTATPAPTSAPAEAVRIMRASPADVAHAVAREFPTVRAKNSSVDRKT